MEEDVVKGTTDKDVVYTDVWVSMGEPAEVWGQRIRELREQKNYTLNKLANHAGVSQSYLRDVELENKNPTTFA